MAREQEIVERIRQIIGNPRGKCYAASEAAYHLLGGREAGYIPAFIRLRERVEGYDTHWWLRRSDGSVLDITADQFTYGVPYDRGVGCGFRTTKPSKKAQEIIDAYNS